MEGEVSFFTHAVICVLNSRKIKKQFFSKYLLTRLFVRIFIRLIVIASCTKKRSYTSLYIRKDLKRAALQYASRATLPLSRYIEALLVNELVESNFTPTSYSGWDSDRDMHSLKDTSQTTIKFQQKATAP
jgi:hypothetical protein